MNNTFPFVSVVMPVYNEAGYIERSLGAVLKQTYPHDLLEVVIADGKSTDETVALIEKLASESDISIKIVNNPKQIAPAALNRAIAEAKGDVIIRIDGHCEVDAAYVANCVALLETGRAEGVGGPIETIGEGSCSRAIALAMSSAFGVGGAAFRTITNREMYTDTVAFPAYTREIVERAGAFNEELVRNQDDEYNYRIRELGGRILLSPTIQSRYFSRAKFKSLWRQYFQYGYWKIRVLQIHPRQMSVRQFVPFIFVVSLIVLTALSFVSVIGRWTIAFLLGSYLLANIYASVYAARNKYHLIPLVSLSYVILHVSYGLGSLFGLIAFRDRWGPMSRRERPLIVDETR